MFQPYEALYDLYAEEDTPWRDVCQVCGLQRIMHDLDPGAYAGRGLSHWFDPAAVTPVPQNP